MAAKLRKGAFKATKKLIPCALAATSIAAAGCAAVESSAEPGGRVHKEEITGSRIPRTQQSAAISQAVRTGGPGDFQEVRDMPGIKGIGK